MKISSRLFMCRHRKKSGSNRVCGGRGKGLQPRVSREAQLAVLLRRRFLHLASLLGCQTGATSLQELHGGTPSPAVHHRSQPRTGARALLPPISLPPVCSGLGAGEQRGVCAEVVVVESLGKAGIHPRCAPSSVGQCVNEPEEKHGGIKATVTATKGVPWAASYTD